MEPLLVTAQCFYGAHTCTSNWRYPAFQNGTLPNFMSHSQRSLAILNFEFALQEQRKLIHDTAAKITHLNKRRNPED